MKQIILYLHGDKMDAYTSGIDAGLSETAAEEFKYAPYEHEMTYEVEETTGISRLIAVDGKTLEAK